MSYCPRCDRETEWANVATSGHRWGCQACGLEDAERVTEEEWERLIEHRPELAEFAGRQ